MGTGGGIVTSDLIAGLFGLAIVAGAVSILLRRQYHERRSLPLHQIPSTLAGAASLVSFVWFFAWAASDGYVPHGLLGFAAAAAFAALALLIRPKPRAK